MILIRIINKKSSKIMKKIKNINKSRISIKSIEINLIIHMAISKILHKILKIRFKLINKTIRII
jgi:hypothetical protein